ncbi:kinase-like domain-containing protein [Dichotomocladium elegans]|nr:kinase-like domain-containing protein [Dichotomocladium elegans]
MCLPFSKSEPKKGRVAHSTTAILDNKVKQRSDLHLSSSRIKHPQPTRPNMAAAFLNEEHQQQQRSAALPKDQSSSSTNSPTTTTKPSLRDSASANPKSIGNYVLQQNLGKGSMGKVKLGVHNVTGEKVAVKIVPRANFQLVALRSQTGANDPTTDGAGASAANGQPVVNVMTAKSARQIAKEQAREHNREMRTIREAHIMMLLRHPHIVGLKDMVVGGPYFYIFMEYVNGGQLLHYIIKRQRLSERRARHFSRQIVSALDYMHRNSIVHRDLKIENIMIDKQGRNVKLIDFGLSNLFGPEKLLTTYCGSLYFAAPELLRAMPYKGPEIDVWSLGVVIYVMVTGAVPFDDKTMPGLHDKIKRGHVTYPAHMSEECRDLLSNIFITDPAKRILLAEVIRHPWLNPDPNTPLVKNFLPPRKPLRLPLDPIILEQMTQGFELGTADEIRQKLEMIVQSPVYQDAARHLADAPLDDPQSVPDAYHPLVSIYHLIRERALELEAAKPPPPPMLSRKASMESALSASGVLGTISAKSSQASLQETSSSNNKVEVPQGDVALPSSLPNRPEYQLLADASVPGFASQPSAAVGSGDYLSRIQRWLRSSTSQHHLVVESPAPTPSSPLSQQQQQQHEPLPTPPDSIEQQLQQSEAAAAAAAAVGGAPTTQIHGVKPTPTIFRKISHAFLRKQPVNPYDKPLPPPPPPPPSQQQQQPSQTASAVNEVTPAPVIPTTLDPPQPQPSISQKSTTKMGHHRSVSSASTHLNGKRSFSVKISAWLNRSSSVHK